MAKKLTILIVLLLVSTSLFRAMQEANRPQAAFLLAVVNVGLFVAILVVLASHSRSRRR